MPNLVFTQMPLAGATTVLGDAGNDVIGGYTGDDTLIGAAGNDMFFEGMLTWGGTSTADFIKNQRYDFGAGNDVIRGGAGDDWLNYANRSQAAVLNLSLHSVAFGAERDGFSGIEYFTLGDGNDRVLGVQTDVRLDLDAGNDTLSGLAGFAFADGGAGHDRLTFAASTAAVLIDLTSGIGPRDSTIKGFEDIIGSQTAANRLTGNYLANTLIGGAADDTLSGGAAADWLVGGAGTDSIDGGLGLDTIYGGGGNDVLKDFNIGVIYGGAGDDTINLTGGQAYGGDGVDTMALYSGQAWGGAGNDVLKLVHGSMAGGSGDDNIRITNTTFATASGDAGNDTVVVHTDGNLRGVTAIFGGAGQDVLRLEGALQVDIFADDSAGRSNGVFGFETITGNAAAQQVWLDATSKWVNLGGGNDSATISGSANTVALGDGNDTATLSGLANDLDTGSGNDSVRITDTFSECLVLTGAGDDTVYVDSMTDLDTGDGQDSVFVEASPDAASILVHTGSGNDVVRVHQGIALLDLGTGDDSLISDLGTSDPVRVTGGAGADHFSFETHQQRGDLVIEDFAVTEDRLALSVQGVAGLADLTSITQVGADVVLFMQAGVSDPGVGVHITLANLTVAAVTDAIFI